MKLYCQKYGQGIPIIIVHGLFGSSDNWLSISKELSSNFEVYLIDQRNHGKSPHDEEFNYDVLMNDLLEFMDDQNIMAAILIGHSLGGKTVMNFAKHNPKRIINIIVVDIAPKTYVFSDYKESTIVNHKLILETLRSVDLNLIKKRKDIDEKISSVIKEQKLRQFLLKNIKRRNDKSFYWTLNINAIYKNLKAVSEGVNFVDYKNIRIEVPSLFVRGADSEYISNEDIQNIEKIFPNSNVVTINNSGHWLHAEQPKQFLKVIIDFILN